MSFAEEIKSVRLESLMSQEAFAHNLGVAFGTVNRWESGKTLPTMDTMVAILKFCEARGFERQAMYNSWRIDKENRKRDKE